MLEVMADGVDVRLKTKVRHCLCLVLPATAFVAETVPFLAIHQVVSVERRAGGAGGNAARSFQHLGL